MHTIAGLRFVAVLLVTVSLVWSDWCDHGDGRTYNTIELSHHQLACVKKQGNRDVCMCHAMEEEPQNWPWECNPISQCSSNVCETELTGIFGLRGKCSTLCDGNKKFQDGVCVEQCNIDNNLLINGHICANYCTTSTYRDPLNSRSCLLCHEECSNEGCYGPEASDCKDCRHVLWDNTCVAHCPFGYTNQNANCIHCHVYLYNDVCVDVISVVVAWLVAILLPYAMIVCACCRWKRGYSVKALTPYTDEDCQNCSDSDGLTSGETEGDPSSTPDRHSNNEKPNPCEAAESCDGDIPTGEETAVKNLVCDRTNPNL